MDIPSVISGTFFTLDGMNETTAGGVGTACASSDLYSDIDLTFRPGRHSVKFKYKKTSNEEKYVFGEDRLKLFEIALGLTDSNEGQGKFSVSEISFPNEVFVGTAGHDYITLHNFTNKTPEFLGSECDGPFKAVKVDEADGNLEFMIEFTPEKGGDFASVLTLKTNIGDYTVDCSGKAEMSDLGKAVFYESFESDFYDDWIFTDNSGEGNYWLPTKKSTKISATRASHAMTVKDI